jgi:hypothetical protein
MMKEWDPMGDFLPEPCRQEVSGLQTRLRHFRRLLTAVSICGITTDLAVR